jgi:hypothetical protein
MSPSARALPKACVAVGVCALASYEPPAVITCQDPGQCAPAVVVERAAAALAAGMQEHERVLACLSL